MLTPFETNRNIAALQNLRWLLLLRGFVISGECIILVSAIYVANYPIKADPIWTLISLSVIVTSLTWYRLHVDYPVFERELFFHLLIDVGIVAGLLYFSGGGTNPLIWFFLLPLIVTATILPQIYTWFMVGLTSAFYMLLIGYHIPLPNLPEPVRRSDIPTSILELQPDYDLNLHTFTLWFGYVLIAGAVAYFVVEMTNTLRERERKLAQVREDALRDERVVALGTLAAGAAHEMGTPLGTIAILTHELQKEYSPERFKDLNSKLAIIRDQIDRCKEALSVLSASAGELKAESGRLMTVGAYVRDVVRQWQKQQPGVPLKFQANGDEPTPSLVADRTLTHALINILNNAAEVSPEYVEFIAHWNASALILNILDRGPGINPELIENAGNRPFSTKDTGLGVGLFLAKATITRLGGTLRFSKRPEGGTSIRITLPLLPAITASKNYGE
ncbi:MAG: ATP-binding protein [Methylococcaceae bacterium]|nr:ATP-binding protein [Methylococcaceae bacterium]MCI0732904.1 ATP-binding protein [Methylococcaceae bacterium]